MSACLFILVLFIIIVIIYSFVFSEINHFLIILILDIRRLCLSLYLCLLSSQSSILMILLFMINDLVIVEILISLLMIIIMLFKQVIINVFIIIIFCKINLLKSVFIRQIILNILIMNVISLLLGKHSMLLIPSCLLVLLITHCVWHLPLVLSNFRLLWNVY